MLKIQNKSALELGFYVLIIGICFEFRNSNFVFTHPSRVGYTDHFVQLHLVIKGSKTYETGY